MIKTNANRTACAQPTAPWQSSVSTGQGHFPELIQGSEAFCVGCGHCVAACPHGAMDHAEVPLAQCPDIDPALAISPAQAEQFLRSRRSVRCFKDKPIEQEVLQRLIETARYAPTASNAQPLAWRVINDRQRVQSIASEVIGYAKTRYYRLPQRKEPRIEWE